jgi:Ca2+-transporting ATPase
MAVGSLFIRVLGEDMYDETVGATMLIATLSLCHIVAAFSAREEYETVFSRAHLPGDQQLKLYGLALLLTILVTEIGLLQRIFGTTSLSFNQWLLCIVVALCLLVIEEVVKLTLRARSQRHAIVG